MSRKYRKALFDSMMSNHTATHISSGYNFMEVSEYDDVRAVWHYRRPYTVCMLYDDASGAYGVGVAKVCWPDKWNVMTGKTISLGKAVADLGYMLETQSHLEEMIAIARQKQAEDAV